MPDDNRLECINCGELTHHRADRGDHGPDVHVCMSCWRDRNADDLAVARALASRQVITPELLAELHQTFYDLTEPIKGGVPTVEPPSGAPFTVSTTFRRGPTPEIDALAGAGDVPELFGQVHGAAGPDDGTTVAAIEAYPMDGDYPVFEADLYAAPTLDDMDRIVEAVAPDPEVA